MWCFDLYRVWTFESQTIKNLDIYWFLTLRYLSIHTSAWTRREAAMEAVFVVEGRKHNFLCVLKLSSIEPGRWLSVQTTHLLLHQAPGHQYPVLGTISIHNVHSPTSGVIQKLASMYWLTLRWHNNAPHILHIPIHTHYPYIPYPQAGFVKSGNWKQSQKNHFQGFALIKCVWLITERGCWLGALTWPQLIATH